MSKIVDISGQTFNYVKVLGIDSRSKNRHIKWKCICKACSKEFTTHSYLLRTEQVISCGCIGIKKAQSAAADKNRTHNGTNTPEFRAWTAMRSRCSNLNDPGFKNYGQRGVVVCDRWLKFENFLQDMGKRPGKGYSIDRIDVNGNYEPANCRWATSKTQANNRTTNFLITHEGKTQTLTQWAEAVGINVPTLAWRIKSGWAVRTALTKPIRKMRR